MDNIERKILEHILKTVLIIKEKLEQDKYD